MKPQDELKQATLDEQDQGHDACNQHKCSSSCSRHAARSCARARALVFASTPDNEHDRDYSTNSTNSCSSPDGSDKQSPDPCVHAQRPHTAPTSAGRKARSACHNSSARARRHTAHAQHELFGTADRDVAFNDPLHHNCRRSSGFSGASVFSRPSTASTPHTAHDDLLDAELRFVYLPDAEDGFYHHHDNEDNHVSDSNDDNDASQEQEDSEAEEQEEEEEEEAQENVVWEQGLGETDGNFEAGYWQDRNAAADVQDGEEEEEEEEGEKEEDDAWDMSVHGIGLDLSTTQRTGEFDNCFGQEDALPSSPLCYDNLLEDEDLDVDSNDARARLSPLAEQLSHAINLSAAMVQGQHGSTRQTTL